MLTFELSISPQLKSFDISPVEKAVQEASQVFVAALQGALTGSVLPGMNGPVSAPEVAQGIQSNASEMAFTVTADLSKIEQGTEPWDMKPGLLNGPRHRVAKDGTRYSIIPFFHDQNKLPSDIAHMASGLSPSFVVGTYIDKLQVERNMYVWGGRLPDMPNSSLMSLDVSGTGYVRKFSRYSGMVNMHGAGLMTFRTVSDKSAPESWWNPGKPGNPVSESVWKFMMPAVEAGLELAWGEVFASWLS